ncbi:hypothetical protein GCM10028822_41230 [Hymenobacter terrigena]
MNRKDIPQAQALATRLSRFTNPALPGVQLPASLDCLAAQLIDSIKRVRYATVIGQRRIQGATVADAASSSFNPIVAAVWQHQHGNLEEACWLVFLSTHFGKSNRRGWGLLRAVYGDLGSGNPWTWARVSTDLQGFRRWLVANEATLRQAGSFGNHRKYESLVPPGTGAGTADTVAGYVSWVKDAGGHDALHKAAQAAGTPQQAFDYLYQGLEEVLRFGRTARFDYLCMLGKLGIATLVPGSAYLHQATGPLRGVRLLFGGDVNSNFSATALTNDLAQLEVYLQLPFGFQVLEDALCNWQKNPVTYTHFSG